MASVSRTVPAAPLARSLVVAIVPALRLVPGPRPARIPGMLPSPDHRPRVPSGDRGRRRRPPGRRGGCPWDRPGRRAR